MIKVAMVRLHLYPSSIYTTFYHLLPFIICYATRLQPRRYGYINVIGSSIDLFIINYINVMMMMINIRVFLFALRFQKFSHQPSTIYLLSFAKW